MALGPFADIEDALIALLEGLAETGLRTPDEFTEKYIAVRRVGGAGDLITDGATVEVQCFGLSRAAGSELAREAQQLILGAPASAPGGQLIDNTWTESGPYYVDYDDPRIHRYVARYGVEFRR